MMEISRRCDNTSASALLLLSNIDADLSNSIYQKLANIMQNCGICKMLIEAYLSSHELTAHHNALSGEYRMPEYIWIFIATAAKHNYEKYRKYRKWLITDTFDNPLYMDNDSYRLSTSISIWSIHSYTSYVAHFYQSTRLIAQHHWLGMSKYRWMDSASLFPIVLIWLPIVASSEAFLTLMAWAHLSVQRTVMGPTSVALKRGEDPANELNAVYMASPRSCT